MTHKQKVLRLLSDRKPHSHHELYQLGCVAHSRISDLRKDGYVIRQWRDGDLYLYELEGALDEAGVAVGTVPPASSSTPSIPTPSLQGAKQPHQHTAHAHAGSRGGGVLTLFESEVAA